MDIDLSFIAQANKNPYGVSIYDGINFISVIYPREYGPVWGCDINLYDYDNFMSLPLSDMPLYINDLWYIDWGQRDVPSWKAVFAWCRMKIGK